MLKHNKIVQSLSLFFLIAATGLSISCLFVDLENYPPFLDYDAATDSSLINNLSYRESYDAGYKDSKHRQDKFRASLATLRLPYSLPTSILQKILAVRPIQMTVFSKALAGFFLLCTLFLIGKIALLLLNSHRPGSGNLSDLLYLIGMGVAYPPLLIFSRTGFHWNSMVHLLFWAIIFSAVRYLTEIKEGRSGIKFLYLGALLFSYSLLNPWTLTIPLPLCVIFFALLNQKSSLSKVATSKHTYFAGFLTILASLVIIAFIAHFHTGNISNYFSRIKLYFDERELRASQHQSYSIEGLSQRWQKLINQQLLFIRDKLGDPTRSDSIFTLGQSISSFKWIFFPLTLLGAIISLKHPSPLSKLSWSVFASFVLVFFSRYFPEGRYTLPLASCFLYFSLIAIHTLTRKHPWSKNFVFSGVILFCLIPVHKTLTTTYQSKMLEEYASYEDTADVISHLPTIQQFWVSPSH